MLFIQKINLNKFYKFLNNKKLKKINLYYKYLKINNKIKINLG